MREDLVRVLRIYEFVGPRHRVEQTLAKSVNNWRDCGNGLTIRAATIGTFPEILGKVQQEGFYDGI